MHCFPNTQSFLQSLLEPQLLMCRRTGGAQTHPIYPREEVVVVHKVARSLIGPFLSSRVGNWEPLSMGRYTIYVKQKLLFDKCALLKQAKARLPLKCTLPPSFSASLIQHSLSLPPGWSHNIWLPIHSSSIVGFLQPFTGALCQNPIYISTHGRKSYFV